MKFIAVLEDTLIDIDDEVGLSTLWVEGGTTNHRRIKNNKNEYQGQVSFAYGENTRLWIVREDEGVLKEESAVFKEYWSNTESSKIPKYTIRAAEEIRSKTTIILPLTGKIIFLLEWLILNQLII